MDICRGQRLPLAQLINNHAQLFHVESSISGVIIDFACFGLNTNSKLLNDDYMVFFNQPQTPCGSIAITVQSNSAVFSCDLNKLPASIERLVFTAAIDGLQTMSEIQSGCLKFLTDNQETANFKFHGSDFEHERSLILGEIYRKNGDWRFHATGQGFNEGLEKLVEYFGSFVITTEQQDDQKINALANFQGAYSTEEPAKNSQLNHSNFKLDLPVFTDQLNNDVKILSQETAHLQINTLNDTLKNNDALNASQPVTDSKEKKEIRVEEVDANINNNQQVTGLNYSFLLLTHMACVDCQIHNKQVDTLDFLSEKMNINDETRTVMDDILSRSDKYLTFIEVIKKVDPSHHERTLYLVYYIAYIDGYFSKYEREFVEHIKEEWKINTSISETIFSQAKAAVDVARQKDKSNDKNDEKSHSAKIFQGLNLFFANDLVNKVVETVGSIAIKEQFKNYRTQALLSGSEYNDAINTCRKIGEQDITVANRCLGQTEQALIELEKGLEIAIKKVSDRGGKAATGAVKEVLEYLNKDKENLNTETVLQLRKIKDLQERKQQAINYFTISFMGKSKAGKSTLHAIVTGEGWDGIGKGKQNTTRLNRVYEWQNIRIIDTPGIEAPDGIEYQEIAETIIDESDLMCFVVTNNNQQETEFKFLKNLKEKGKPLLILVNIHENLDSEKRLQRFLKNPDKKFSDDKKELGGHIDRIREYTEKYYGSSEFLIIPVQLLAARLSMQESDKAKSAQLMKASRLQKFLDAVRVSLITDGVIQRSQNLLGSTVVDIEQPLVWLKDRIIYYRKFAKNMEERKISAINDIDTAGKTHHDKLSVNIKNCFENLHNKVPDFADTYWDSSESSLNSAWEDNVNFLYKEINRVVAATKTDFSDDIKKILEEIEREILLTEQLNANAFKLYEQKSSEFGHKATKWGGTILGLVGLVSKFIPPLVPISLAITVVGVILGFLSSLLESKATKKRKAVARISETLENQIDKQEKDIIVSVMNNFDEQCDSTKSNVVEYFDHLILGVKNIASELEKCTSLINEMRDEMNICFASRVLDFAEGKIKDLDLELVRQRIRHVDREVGQSIEITLAQPLKQTIESKMNELGKKLQETITIVA